MVYLVCMDAKYKVLGCHKLGEGTVNAADITPAGWWSWPWPTTPPPSSWPTTTSQAWPSSNADLLTTETLARVLREVGVELADHLIFTEDDMVSLKDSGLLNGYPNPY